MVVMSSKKCEFSRFLLIFCSGEAEGGLYAFAVVGVAGVAVRYVAAADGFRYAGHGAGGVGEEGLALLCAHE